MAAETRRGRRDKDEGDDEEKGTNRMLVYTLRDLKTSIDDLGTRLDTMEETISLGTPQAGEEVTPPAFKTVQERAVYEGIRKHASTMGVKAVSSTRLVGAQQEETLALLEERQSVADRVDEVFLSFASIIEEHELLKRLRSMRGTPWINSFMRIVPIIGILIVAAIVAEGIFQPQNFAQIVAGLQNPRNLLIVLAVVGVILGVYAYGWIIRRRQPRAGSIA